MTDQHPKPGDTIEIIWPGHNKEWLGQQHTVVECPDSAKSHNKPGCVWIIDETFYSVGGCLCFLSGHYRVIKQATCDDDVDAFLDRQRDKNLARLFGY